MRIEAGEMAAGPGRDPAAQGRIFEALRKMPHSQPVRLELGFERRAEDAGLDARGARAVVDLEHPVKMPQVEADRGLAPAALDPRFDPADDAAAGAERDQRRLSTARPIDDRSDVGFALRIGDDIGGRVIAAGQTARVVGKRLAVCMGDSIVSLGRAIMRQISGWEDARRAQPDIRECRRRHLVESIHPKEPAVAVERGCLLGVGQSFAFATPAEMFEPRLSHRDWLWASRSLLASPVDGENRPRPGGGPAYRDARQIPVNRKDNREISHFAVREDPTAYKKIRLGRDLQEIPVAL